MYVLILLRIVLLLNVFLWRLSFLSFFKFFQKYFLSLMPQSTFICLTGLEYGSIKIYEGNSP
jgi:hypothetical protein